MDILIAEDDRTSRLLLQAALTSLGHAVTSVGDGTEARGILQQRQFPIVISDWIMPGCDGLELCRLARSNERGGYTYFILLTSVGGKENYLAAMDAGVDDFVSKPLDRDQLAARLRAAERILALQGTVNRLEGLIPICSYCKSVRDDNDYWQQVESYIASRTDAVFSHGICPSCYQTHVEPKLAARRKAREQAKDSAA